MFSKKEKKHKGEGTPTDDNSTEAVGRKASKRSPERKKKRDRKESGGSIDSRKSDSKNGDTSRNENATGDSLKPTSVELSRSSERSSLPTLEGEAVASSETTHSNGGPLRSGEERALTAESIQTTLRRQLVYFSGGLDGDHHLILTVPGVGLRNYDSDSYKEFCTTLQYFKTLMRPDQMSEGVTLLIDAQSTKTHVAAKMLIESLASESPSVPLHVIYVLMKQSFFNRPKHLVTPEQAGSLHLAYLYDHKSLLEQLDEANVIAELGGTLCYNHEHWVHNRLQYEHIVKLHGNVIAELPNLVTALDLCELAKDVKDAEKLMQEDLKLKETIVGKIAEAEVAIDKFMDEMKQQRPEDTFEISPATKDHITMLSLLNGMLEELKEKQKEFDTFWALHRARVDHMMRMCHFSRGVVKIQTLMQGHIDDLTESNVVVGDNLESALELGEKHEAFVTKCKETMDDHMTTIRREGQELLHPKFNSHENEENMHDATRKTISLVREKIQAVSNTYQELMTTCQQKRNLFIVCVRFHMNMRQFEQWHQEVLEFLAAQPLEEPSQQVAASLLSHIDSFLNRMTASQVAALKELTGALPGKQYKKAMQKTETKYEQTRELLEKRKASVLKILAASYLPPPTPPGSPFSRKKNSQASSEANSLLQTSGECVDGEEESKMVKGRQFVYKELVATEADYVRDLECVVNSYYDEMDPNNLSIPLRLRGKRSIVFGNLLEIFKFHDQQFREALEQYANCPERVGECFLQYTQEFQMYSAYCKNRTNSETLINESTESQAFFKGMQMQLAQALPLNSYLIKPIQRITKYQLLLKDMLKHSVNMGKAHSDLQMALDRMLKVLKNLNDSLHVVGLKGFPGALAEQGRLLIHDAFHLWESCGRTRDRFARGKDRHVFLYEKVIIFSKKIEAPVQRRERKSDTYIYKGHVQMAELTLREMQENQALQFEIALQGQNKIYKFQAHTSEICDMWAKEIRRLLQAQFTLMKDMVLKSGTLNRATYRGKARLSTLTRDSRLFGDSFKNPEPKKSLADRFKILKRRKVSDQQAKKSALHPARICLTASLPATAAHGLLLPVTHSFSGREDTKTPDSEISEDSKSSDEEFTFSDEEDDGLEATAAIDHYESLAPGAARYYTAISDYNPGDSDVNGISLSEDQEIEVIGINQYGWWWVRATNYFTHDVEEGWVPASYLKVSMDQTVPSS